MPAQTKKKMANFKLIVIFVVCNLFLLSNVAPKSLDAIELRNLSEIIDNEKPVRYDGAQLWSVEFSDDRSKQIVIDLKRSFG